MTPTQIRSGDWLAVIGPADYVSQRQEAVDAKLVEGLSPRLVKMPEMRAGGASI
jgi:hypothetical protein